MSLIRISESENWIVDYDTERGIYKVSYFEDGHFVDQHRFDCYEEKELGFDVRNRIADEVEDKMMYMCGCRNCIEKVKMIIKDEVKLIENQCKYCKIECDARST